MKAWGIRMILRDGTHGWMEEKAYCLKASDQSGHLPAVEVVGEDESLSNLYTGGNEGCRQGQPCWNWDRDGRRSSKHIADRMSACGGNSREREREMDEPKYVVRRITPREAERLQSFPDDYTNIIYNGKPAPDTARYKALGNSMTVNVMQWIAKRILMIEKGEL